MEFPLFEKYGIVGQSSAMQKVYDTVTILLRDDQRVANAALEDSDYMTVNIHARTGCGKEGIVKLLHNESALTKGKPLSTVNCGAFEPTLLRDELFGHADGAYTDAKKKREGLFGSLAGGTLLLDEVDQMPFDMQVALLRVLEEQTYRSLGEDGEKRYTGRIVTASSKDLSTLTAEGIFREDLFYRLNVFPISLPLLTEREGDIDLLADHFVRKYGTSTTTLGTEARQKIHEYGWPGNVRELEQSIRGACVRADGGEILADHLVLHNIPSGQRDLVLNMKKPLPDALLDLEIAAIRKTLPRCRTMTSAASVLGLKRTTLSLKLKRHGISKPKGWQ